MCSVRMLSFSVDEEIRTLRHYQPIIRVRFVHHHFSLDHLHHLLEELFFYLAIELGETDRLLCNHGLIKDRGLVELYDHHRQKSSHSPVVDLNHLKTISEAIDLSVGMQSHILVDG